MIDSERFFDLPENTVFWMYANYWYSKCITIRKYGIEMRFFSYNSMKPESIKKGEMDCRNLFLTEKEALEDYVLRVSAISESLGFKLNLKKRKLTKIKSDPNRDSSFYATGVTK